MTSIKRWKWQKEKIGEKYQGLTLLKVVGTNKWKQKVGLFQCDCGEKKEIRISAVKNRGQETCGGPIHRKEVGLKKRKSFSVGDQYNYLTLIKYDHSDKHNCAHWLCRCRCGTEKIIDANKVKFNHIKSCGCRDIKYETLTKEETYKANAKMIFNGGYKDGDLTLNEFMELSQKNCYYCDCPPKNKAHRAFKSDGTKRKIGHTKSSCHEKHPDVFFVYNGLDRIDSKLPHNKNNVISCCHSCNMMKMDRAFEDHLLKIKIIYENLNLKEKIPEHPFKASEKNA